MLEDPPSVSPIIKPRWYERGECVSYTIVQQLGHLKQLSGTASHKVTIVIGTITCISSFHSLSLLVVQSCRLTFSLEFLWLFMMILYERCIIDAKNSVTVSDTHKLYQTHITHFFRLCLICSIICKPLFSFQTQNQACQQVTDEMDKEYKKLSDNIKECSEKVKVHIFMPVVSCEYLISFYPKVWVTFFRQSTSKAQSSTTRGTTYMFWTFYSISST
jgi:hypothetical protein